MPAYKTKEIPPIRTLLAMALDQSSNSSLIQNDFTRSRIWLETV